MAEEKIKRFFKMVVIGGSSGGLEVLLNILSLLKKDFNIPLLIVLHRNNDFESRLVEVLASRSNLAIKEVEEKEAIRPATVYVAPRDYHVLIENNHSFSLDFSEKVHYSRPSIDVSFMAAADVYKDALLCILVSGANSDGADGLAYVHSKGGVTIVQDPNEAPINFMPAQAMRKGNVDFVYLMNSIALLLNQLS